MTDANRQIDASERQRPVRLLDKFCKVSGLNDPAIYIIVLLGVIGRVILLAVHPLQFAVAEAELAAVSVARNGSIAAIFPNGGGLTAHLTPAMPLLAGLVYAIFGVKTVAAEAVLAALSIGVATAGALTLNAAFSALGVPRIARLCALGMFFLLPIHWHFESVEFRAWEGGVATLLAALHLFLLIRYDQKGILGNRELLIGAILSAVLFFVSPPLGLFGYAGLGVLVLRRLPARRWPVAGALIVIILAAVLSPWVVRNYVDFGRFIPLRSNLGLELAQANFDGAAAANDLNEQTVFLKRAKEIHPYSAEGFARMQAAGGEISYSDQLLKTTKAWIQANPAQFRAITLRHLRHFYLPAIWEFDEPNGKKRSEKLVLLRFLVTWGVSITGMLGAVMALCVWRKAWLYPALMATLPCIPYAFVQPIVRYSYLVWGVQLFLAVALVTSVVRYGTRARRTPNEMKILS